MPVWVIPIVLAALLVIGLAVPGWAGAAALVLVAAFLGWLAALSWPRLAGPGGYCAWPRSPACWWSRVCRPPASAARGFGLAPPYRRSRLA